MASIKCKTRCRAAGALFLAMVAGCATPPEQPARLRLAQPRTMHSSGPVSSSRLAVQVVPPPAAIAERTLAYLAGLRTPGDASLERFADVLGPLVTLSSDGGDYAELLAAYPETGWTVTVGASERAVPAVRYQVSHDRLLNDTLESDMAPVCGTSLVQFRSALVAAGFVQGPILPRGTGPVDGRLTYTFSRGALHVDIVAQPRNARASGPSGACVRVMEAQFLTDAPQSN